MSSTGKQSTIELHGRSPSTDHLTFYSFAQERSQAYWLLSRLFLKAPDASHLRQLETDLAAIDDLGPLGELRREVESCLPDPDPAVSEFSRLVLIAGKSDGDELPYESFVREGSVPGAITAEVGACMSHAGFSDIAPDAPSLDHIGAELKFMAMLCFEESQAWTAGKRNQVKHLIVMQRHFLVNHLAAWAPEYCERLEERAVHGYVKALARLTRRCLISEVAAVEHLFIFLNQPDHISRYAGVHRAASSH